MMQFFMNADGTLGHGLGSIVSGGSFSISSVASTKVKAVGKGVFFGNLSFTFSGGNAPGCDPGTVFGTGAIAPTSTKNKNASGMFVVRETDSVNVTMNGTLSGSPVSLGPQPVEVVSAGQSKVKGE